MSESFVETQALVAVLDRDDEELDRILSGMLRNELTTLAAACYVLAERCRRASNGGEEE